MTVLKDLVRPVSASEEAVLIGYGDQEARVCTLISRMGEKTGHSVLLIGLKVRESGGSLSLFEVPELRDPSSTNNYCFRQIQAFRYVKPGSELALVVYHDHFSTTSGYDGSIRALVPLPNGKDNVAYSAKLDLDDFLRAMFPVKSLQSLD